MSLSIITLGTKGYIPEHKNRYRKHSGILIDSSILLDVGEKQFLKHNPLSIFITHFHPDHAFFVTEKAGPIDCNVYGPSSFENPKVHALKRSMKIDGFKISPIPTIHTFKIPSQGYLIEGKGKRIFYSGDIITIEKKHLSKLKELDAVITEASYFRKGGMIRKFAAGLAGHNGIRELVDLFRPYTNKIIFTHFGTWFLKDIKKAKEMLRKLSDETLTIEVAFDGKEFLI